MQEQTISVPSGPCTVRVGGPDSGHAVLFLPALGDAADVFDVVAERLHNSDLKTIAPATAVGLTDADVLALLDELTLPWVNLVGRREGADRAWSVAARTFGRVVSLVAVDRGHPAAAEEEWADSTCPAVEVRTTVVVSDPIVDAHARASSRFVYGDFRVVALEADPTVDAGAAAGLATEIVLRTSSW